MAATTLVSSVPGSRMLQRKPTAATCRLQGATAAPGMNSRHYTRSTCPPFRLRPSSGKKPSSRARGTLLGSSGPGALFLNSGWRLAAYRLVERQTSNKIT